MRRPPPDLVLLDVQMPRMSGLEVVRAIGVGAMPATVFVTAHENFAVDAFEVEAVDYLLKPFRDSRFEEAMEHGRRKVAAALGRYPDRLALRMHGPTITVTPGRIDYVAADGPHVRLHIGKENHLVHVRLRGGGRLRVGRSRRLALEHRLVQQG